jgi:hypothetical protein
MSERVLKWDVPVDDEYHPIGAGQVALVAIQHNPNVVNVWTVEDARDAKPDLRPARVYGTGQPVDLPEHLGSVLAFGGSLVWHVFGGTR